MDKIIRQKATIKIEITKTSKKKVNVKLSRYSTATSDMTPQEKVKHFKSECFECPNEPAFLENLTQNILKSITSVFDDKGVEEINCQNEIIIYKQLV